MKERKRRIGRVKAKMKEHAPNNSYSRMEYYEDISFTCEDCGRVEIWAAEKQKIYFERWKKPIYHRPVRCRDCRALWRLASEKNKQSDRKTPDC